MATTTGTFTLRGNDLGNLPSYSNIFVFVSNGNWAGAGSGTLGTTFIECLDGYVAYIVSNGGTMTYTIDGPGTWDAGTDTIVTINVSDLPSEGGDIRHYNLIFQTEDYTYPVVWRTAAPAVPTLCNTCQFIQLTQCGDDDFRVNLGLPDGPYTAYYTDNTSGVIWEQGTYSDDSQGGLLMYQWFATAGMFNQYSFYTLTIRDTNGDSVSWVIDDVEYSCATITFRTTVNVTD